MDVQVIADIPDLPDLPDLVVAVPLSDSDAPAHGPDVRRFTPDPATSPALLAALAWHAVGPRR